MVVADLRREPDQQTGDSREHQCRRRPRESVHSITSLVGARVVPGSGKKTTSYLEAQAAGVERGGIELGAEILERTGEVVAEDMLDHPDLRVVVERQVDVLVRDEVHRRPLARRAADGEAERAVARRQ